MNALQSVILTLHYCLETFEQNCQCGSCDPCVRGQDEIRQAIQTLEDALPPADNRESTNIPQCAPKEENPYVPDNNGHTLSNPEFQLHVLKHMREQRPPVYTIAIWEPACLRAICHVTPLADALQALSRELENHSAFEGYPRASLPLSEECPFKMRNPLGTLNGHRENGAT
jgi:hypothetical protein